MRQNENFCKSQGFIYEVNTNIFKVMHLCRPLTKFPLIYKKHVHGGPLKACMAAAIN
jgi:hypothetical protein